MTLTEYKITNGIHTFEELHDFGFYYYQGLEPENWDTFDKVATNLRSSPILAFDTETPSLNDRQFLGIGIAPDEYNAIYIVNYYPRQMKLVKELLANPSIIKIAHNAPYDLEVLIWENIQVTNLLDTLTMARFAGLPGRLTELAEAMGWIKDEISDILIKGQTMMDLPEKLVAEKCMWDVRATIKFFWIVQPETDTNLVAGDGKVMGILTAGAHIRGMRVDQEMRDRLDEPLKKVQDSIKDKCADGDYEFNPGSPDQVSYVLALEGYFLPVKKSGDLPWDSRKRARLTADEAVLLPIAEENEIARDVLRYRQVQKKRSSYLTPVKGIDRVHAHFHFEAGTHRCSTSGFTYIDEPAFEGHNGRFEKRLNMVGVPKDLRRIFVPDSGIYTRFDRSQEEIRILRYLSGDPYMGAILDDPDGDFHSATADFMMCDRDTGKNTTFAVVYGAGPETVAATAKTSYPRAEELIKNWSKAYPTAWEWMEGQKQVGIREGVVYTMQGRPMVLPEIGDGPGQEDEGAIGRKAVNYPIQGTGAEILRSDILIAHGLLMDIRMPQHDELVLDGNYGLDFPREKFEDTVAGMFIPISIEMSDRWS